MKTAKFNGNYIELYDEIDKLPIERFKEFNKYLMIDGGIGGDMESVDGHIVNLMQFIRRKDEDKAIQELNNMRQNYYFIIERINPEMNAFCTLVKTINGKPYDDLSDEGMTKLQSELSKKGLTIGKMRGWLHEVKKNWTANLNFSFR